MSSEKDQQAQWDKILSGKTYPDENCELEQKAHRTRQVILWGDAKKASHLSPLQAEQIYHNAFSEYQKRKRRKRINYSLMTLLVLLLSYAVLHYFYKGKMVIADSNQLNTSTPISIKTVGVLEKITRYPYMIEVPEGSFLMGCQAGWDDVLGGCKENEKPAHSVKIKKFALAKYETTVGQFKQFVNATHYQTTAERQSRGCTLQNKEGQWIVSRQHNWKNPGFQQTDNHPVVCISWEDAHAYIRWLSQTTDKSYRLPSESEWEYAARGGKATAFFWGESADRHFANFRGIEGNDQWQYTSPVGAFGGNGYDLYDMAGNAWEWVEDCWRENYKSECKNQQLRTRRGGGWDNYPLNIRHAYRSKDGKIARSYLYGFRVAHDLE